MKIKRFEFNMLPVNCYLVYDSTKEAAIIDPGCFYAEERDFLRDYIKSKGLTPKHLLCTHLHLDHVFGCKFIKDTYGLGIEANPADEYWLQQAPQQARTFGLTYPEIHEPIEQPLFDGDKVTFGDLELEAICVPGHSPGSLAFYSREKKVLFSGDVLFQGSIGRADLQGGNFEELKEAICNRLFTLPDDVTVYPGHGPSTTIGYEKRNNPFFI
ncbi:MAG TPA: MBL fold metallo-hydrolase [Candidatus Avibacteroides avistercoris]|uniref:MBL fold metallo-hydrolase n=1 Tax=Candidatus Avibacteroides avistercoris TaxID=2840690 RepID=A0A9D2UHJ5_9BACT|nr:MBL fold metallo-hydrolase [Candidatus Avibacteroides avistercoris]